MEENPKRRLEGSPGLKRGEDRKAYDKWYRKHHQTSTYEPVDPSTKYKKQRDASEELWRTFCLENQWCIDNNVNPDDWRKIRDSVKWYRGKRNKLRSPYEPWLYDEYQERNRPALPRQSTVFSSRHHITKRKPSKNIIGTRIMK